MGLRISHNMVAMNAEMNLNKTFKNTSKSMEKLSSGYRINRAADDAAGLAISQKMRAQIRGLDQAASNAMDGISLIQTAEGGMQEAQTILHRIREIGVQASNDTNTTMDREALNQEVEQLLQEVDRIAQTTEFNTMKLLDGELGGKIPATKLGVLGTETNDWGFVTVFTMKLDITTIVQDTTIFINGDKFEFSHFPTGDQIQIGTTPRQTADNFKDKIDAGGRYAASGAYDSGNGIIYNIEIEDNPGAVFHFGYKNPPDKEAPGLIIQVGANSGQEVPIKTGDLRTNVLGISDASVVDFPKAQDTITAADAAINTVSKARGRMGATQNRLEHTINMLDVASENTTASESRISDTDVADEMIQYAKQNILTQSSEAVLAQANKYTEGMLNMLTS